MSLPVAALEALLSDTAGWDLFALARLVAALSPEAAPIGATGPAAQEAIRLRGHLSLSFPTRDVATVHVNKDGSRVEIEVAFLTLYGIDSPLAPGVTEALLREEDPEARERVRDFLDIFNHRLLSLLVRAWGRGRIAVSGGAWGEDAVTRLLDDLLDLPELPAEAGISRGDLLPFAGMLLARPRSAHGLEAVLRATLPPEMGVSVLSCVPREVQLHRRDQSMLGLRNCRLGRSLTLGDTVWDATGKLRVRLGPVARDEVEALQPGGEHYARVAALVRLWCQEPLPWDLELRLAPDALRGAVLGGDHPSRLGADAWLGEPTAAQTSIFVTPTLGDLDA